MRQDQARVEKRGLWLDARNVGHHVDLVLPLKLGPHRPELRLVAIRWLDVVHDVDVDVVEDNVARDVRGSGAIVDDVAEDDTRLRRGDLDGCLDRVERMRAKRVRRRPLDELEVTEGGEFDREVLERLGRLIDDEDVEEDVELVDVHVGLGVDRVRETRELYNALELGDEVVLDLGSARRAREVGLVLGEENGQRRSSSRE